MPISRKYKIIFIHIPKNAGTSIISALNMVDEGHHLPEYYQHKYPNEWLEYKKIAVIRNPWDRVVSNYEYSKMAESYWHSHTASATYGPHPDYNLVKNLSFEECVNLLYKDRTSFKHHGWASQYTYTVDTNKNNVVDYLIRYENLNDEIKNLFDVDLIKINQSTYKNYKEYYTKDLIEKISQVYDMDIDLFNFKF